MLEDAPAWPGDLAHVLAQLTPDTFQPMIETRMDSGHVRRRPRTSPIPVLQGTVRLDGAAADLLERFALHIGTGLIRLPSPHGLAQLRLDWGDGQWLNGALVYRDAKVVLVLHGGHREGQPK